jgi:predicted RNA-binding protein YlqC (UPF0109 family)
MTISEFLKDLVSKIVDNPKDVDIKEETVGENSALYTITTNTEDVGKVIGREGKIIRAIRNVSKILAIKENKQIRIEIS